jgi:hypothetical protein
MGNGYADRKRFREEGGRNALSRQADGRCRRESRGWGQRIEWRAAIFDSEAWMIGESVIASSGRFSEGDNVSKVMRR